MKTYNKTNKIYTKGVIIIFVLLATLSFTKINAQNDVYTFDYIYQMEIETPRGRKTVIDYYLPSSGGYFCSKTEGGVVVVFDNVRNKMYTYMGRDDDKIMMSMPFSIKDIVKEINDEEDPRVYEAAGYGILLGHDCTLFRMTSDKLTSEVWIAEDLSEGFVGVEGSFAENAGSEFFGYILGRSVTVNDDSLKAMYLGLPLKIVTSKKRGRREKITTMQCIKFEQANFQINTSEYRRL